MLYGDDIVYNLVQALKFISFEDDIQIKAYNPNRGGYVQLIDLDRRGKSYTYMLSNSFDFFTD